MNKEITDRLDGQRKVGRNVGLVDYKLRTIITRKRERNEYLSGTGSNAPGISSDDRNILHDFDRAYWKAKERRENRGER